MQEPGEGDVERQDNQEAARQVHLLPLHCHMLAHTLVHRLILYDTAGKSGGICAKVFDHINTLIAQAADTIANCRCSQGCPSCAYDSRRLVYAQS